MPFDNEPGKQVPQQETSEYEAFEAALQIAARDTRAAMLRLAKAIDEKERAEAEREADHR